MFSAGWRLWLKQLSSRTPSRRGRVAKPSQSARPAAEFLETRLAPATFVWDGGGTNGRWTTPQNWVGDVAPPTAGNADLVFPAGAAQTTNINDYRFAVFNSITISGGGYILNPALDAAANAITLGSSTPATGYITTNATGTNRIAFNILMGGAIGNRQFFTVSPSSSTLEIAGQISGSTGVTLSKSGDGVLTLANNNSGFTGPITVVQGPLKITNANALGSTTNRTTVQTNAQLAIENVTGTIQEPITLNGPGPSANGALLNVAGNNTWNGAIRLDSTSTLGASAGTLTITGQISDLGAGYGITKEGPGTIVLDPLNTASGNVYRGITTVNQGILAIRHSLALGEGGSAANGTVVTANRDRAGTLQLQNTNNAQRIDPNRNPGNDGFNVTTERLTINGPGLEGINAAITTVSGSLNNLSGNNTWTSDLVLWSSPTFLGIYPAGTLPPVAVGVEDGTTLTIDGIVREGNTNNINYSLNKVRPGRLIFTNNNTYTSVTNVLQGFLNIRDSHGLGPNNSDNTIVSDGATLEFELDAKVDSVTGNATNLTITEPITINGRGNGNVGAIHSISGINRLTSAVTIAGATPVAIGVEADDNPNADETYFTNDWSLTIAGQIRDNNPLAPVNWSKILPGHLILSGNNPYLGQTSIEAGWVTAQSNQSLGGRRSADPQLPGQVVNVGFGETVQPGTVVASGAALHLRKLTNASADLVLTENLTVSGFGISHPYAPINNRGAIMNLGGNNIIGGPDATGNHGGNIVLGGNVGMGVQQLPGFTTSELTLTGTLGEQPPVLSIDRQAQGGPQEDRFPIDTGATSGTVTITYDFFSIPDQLRVYYEGVRLFDTGMVSGSATIVVPYGPGASTIVEIVMNEGGSPQRITRWVYSVTIQPDTLGSGGITKFGDKRLNIQGQGIYKGDVIAREGVLRVQSDTALGADTGRTVVETGAALEFARTNAQFDGGLSSGVQIGRNEKLILNGPGNTTLTGSLISTLSVAADDHLWRGPVTLNTNANINIATDSRLSLLGNINDGTTAAGFTKTGAGKLALGGINTYRGQVNVNAGVLNVQSSTAMGDITGGTVVAANASVEIQGTVSIGGESLTLGGGPGVTPVPAIAPTWFDVGPAPLKAGPTDNNDLWTGRISGIATDPSDSNVIYVTAAGGGAWRSRDGGATWQQLLDSYATNNPIFAGALAVAKDNPAKIYVGLGEANWFSRALTVNSADTSQYGSGVVRTLNGGRTWTLLTNNNGFNPIAGKGISKIIIDPFDTDVIYVATSDLSVNGTAGVDPTSPVGVYRFVRGQGWTCLTNFVTPNRSVPMSDTPPGTPGPDDEWDITFPTSNATWSDLAVFPVVGMPSTTRLFASLGTPGAPIPNTVYMCLDARAALPIWQIGDGGRNSGGGTIIPNGSSTAGRTNFTIKLAGGETNVYAAIGRDDAGNTVEIWRTTGATGLNWELTETVANLGFDFYHATFIANPTNNASLTIAGLGRFKTSPTATAGVGPLRSIDSGDTFPTDLGAVTSGILPHVDYHATHYDAMGRLLFGTDGGLWRLDNESPLTYVNLNGNLNISQFNGIATHPTSSDIIIGGTQDNDSLLYTGGRTWDTVNNLRADGGYAAIDPSNPNILYQSAQNGFAGWLNRSTNGGTTWTAIDNGLPGTGRFYSRIKLDPLNPSRIVVAESNLFERDFDLAGNAWIDLGGGNGAPIEAFDFAGLQGTVDSNVTTGALNDPQFTHVLDKGANTYDPDTLYFASAGQLRVTKDHGRTWATRTPPGGGTFSDLEVDPTNRDTVFVTRKVFGGRHVQMTDDSGQSWTDISFDLPNTPTWAVAYDPRFREVYVGTDVGVFKHRLGTTNWTRFGSGMPDAQIRDLVLNTTLNTLTAASYGRGVWQTWLEGPALINPGDTFGTIRSISGTGTWTGPVTITGDLYLRAENGSSFTIVGTIDENETLPQNDFKLIKTGLGNVVLAGQNGYDGLTEVREGALGVRNPQALGTTGLGTVVSSGAALELQSSVDLEPLTLNGEGGTLNGHRTGALRSVSNTNTYSGPIVLIPDTQSGNTTIGVDSDSQLTVTGVISGNTDFVKELTGTLVLAATNTYTGLTSVNQGALRVSNATALGTSAVGTRVLDGAQLQLEGGITVTSEALELSGTGINRTGALLNTGGNNTWAGTITFAKRAGFSPPTTPPNEVWLAAVANSLLTIDTNIQETAGTVFGLTKVGAGTVALKRQNSHRGLTLVQEGTLNIQHNLALGTSGTAASGTRVLDGATLELATVGTVTGEQLFLNGLGFNGVGAVNNAVGDNRWNAVITLESLASVGALAGTTFTLNNNNINTVTGGGDFEKVGAGTVLLPTTNNYTGATDVLDGVLRITHARALGTTAAGTFVVSPGTLEIDGSLTVVGEALSLSGAGFGGIGALHQINGTSTWNNPITLTGDASVGVGLDATGAFDTLVFDRAVGQSGGSRGLTKVGRGTLVFTGNAGNANTYNGLTTVAHGILVLSKFGAGEQAIAGNVQVGDGTGAVNTARLAWNADNQVNPLKEATVLADGQFDLVDHVQTLAKVTVNDGHVLTGTTGVLTVNALDMTGGSITVGGAAAQVILSGDVTATSSNATGPATVTGPGTLLLNQTVRTFTIADGPNATDMVVDSVIGGPLDLIKRGAGVLRFTKTNTYTGHTDIFQGTLLVDGRIGEARVRGGTLGGSGTTGLIDAANGAVSPGDASAGTGLLTAAGNVTFIDETDFVVNLNGLVPGTSYDRLAVQGNVSLGNSELVGVVGFPGSIGDTFTILTTTGNLTGSFAQGNRVFVGDQKFRIDYDRTPGAGSVTLTRVKTDSLLALTSNLNPSTYGQPLSFTATMGSETGMGVPSGFVTFTIVETGQQMNVPIDALTSTAVFVPPTTLNAGDYTITATYAGDINFAGSAAQLTQTVKKSEVLRSISFSPDPVVFGQPLTVSFQITAKAPGLGVPTQTINFSVDGVDRGVLTLDATGRTSTILTDLTADLHRFDVKYNGDPNFIPFNFNFFPDVLFAVNKANSAVAAVTSSLAPSIFGQMVTFSTRVTAVSPGAGRPTGTVTFFDGTTPIATGNVNPTTGVASVTTPTALTGGTHQITAVYNGDASFNTANSSANPFAQVVQRSTTGVGVTASPVPTVFGQLLTLTATVIGDPPGVNAARPTGTITFIVDGTPRGTRPIDINGRAVLTVSGLDAGARSIVVTYDGDTNFATSTGNISHTIDKANTATGLTTSLTPSVYGQELTFRATVSVLAPGAGQPGGSVTFFVDGTAASTQALSGSGLAFFRTTTLNAGNRVVTARYDGDGNFNVSTSSAVNQVVNSSDANWTITPSIVSSVFGQPVTFTVTVGARAPGAGTPTGSVTVKVDGSDRPAQNLVSGQASFTLTNLTAGSHKFDVSYNGDGNFNGYPFSTFAEYLYTVTKASTATTRVTTSRNPSLFGEALTFTTTVLPVAPGAGVPTGVITFLDGSTPIGTGNLDASGAASFTTTTPLRGGAHVITARYPGDTNFNGSNSSANPLNQTVNPSTSTTNVSATPNPSVPGQTVTVTADVIGNQPGQGAAIPSGTVTFALDGINQRTVALDVNGRAVATFPINSTGTHQITATYNGDSNFATSLGSFTQTVSRFVANLGLTSSVNPSVLGQGINFRARVTPGVSGATQPTGTVTFFVDGAQQSTLPLDAAGNVTFTTATLSAGSHVVRADYNGDANYEAGATGSVTQTVNKVSSTTTLAAPTPNPSIIGQAVSLRATVRASTSTTIVPTGTVTFFDGTTSLGTGTLDGNGVATLQTSTLTGGVHQLTARFEGDNNFNASTSGPVSQTVNKGSSAISNITSSVNPSVFGQSFNLTTTVTAVAPATGTPTGTVTFREGTAVVGTATLNGSGVATLNVTTALSAGAHTLTATYNGDTNFNASAASAAFTQNVNKANTTTTLGSQANPSAFGQTSVVATVVAVTPGGGIPTGTVTFLENGSPLGTPVVLDSNGRATLPATLLTPGTHTVTATFSGSTNFNGSAASNPVIQTVNKGNSATTITTSAQPAVVGETVTFTATVAPVSPATGTATGTVVFTVDGVPQPGVTLDSNGRATLGVSNLTVGTHQIGATYAGDNTFNGSAATTFNQNVITANTATTLTASPSSPRPFGTPLTLTATVTVVPPGTGTVAGTVTFLDGTTTLGTATLSGTTATFTTTDLPVGAHQLVARFEGSASVTGSSSQPVAYTVNKANAAVGLTSSRNVAVRGRNISFTATVTSSAGAGTATGTVDFLEGTTVLGSATLANSRATFTTAFTVAGNRTVTARYNGDANLNANTSGPVTVLVGTLNQAWVSQVYLDLFNRNVDSGGLTYWTGLLDSAALTSEQIVTQLENSAEYRGIQIRAAYQTYLRRQADSSAITSFTPFLQNGGHIGQLRAILLGSDEYFRTQANRDNATWITKAAQDTLGTDVDAATRATFLSMLASGVTRQSLATNLLLQTVTVDRQVNGLYQTYLRRTADAGGLTFFRGFLQNGGTEEAIVAKLIASAEFFGKL